MKMIRHRRQSAVNTQRRSMDCKILEEKINHNHNNSTRFIVVTESEDFPEEGPEDQYLL